MPASAGRNVASKTTEPGSIPGAGAGSCERSPPSFAATKSECDSRRLHGVVRKVAAVLGRDARSGAIPDSSTGAVHEDEGLPCKQTDRVRLPAAPLSPHRHGWRPSSVRTRSPVRLRRAALRGRRLMVRPRASNPMMRVRFTSPAPLRPVSDSDEARVPLEHGGSVTLWPLREPVIKVVDVGCNPTRIGAIPIGLSTLRSWWRPPAGLLSLLSRSDSERARPLSSLCRGGFRASPSEGEHLGSTPSRETSPLVLAAPGTGLRTRLFRFNSERGVRGKGRPSSHPSLIRSARPVQHGSRSHAASHGGRRGS
jgi:hypothetical protein